MVISNSLAIDSMPRPTSSGGPGEGFSHVSESPQLARPTTPSRTPTNVADKLAAMGISSSVDHSLPTVKKLTPDNSKPSTPDNDNSDFQPVAPAPGFYSYKVKFLFL